MQTFLPYQSFDKSAAALDNRRLGKQRVETLQILKALTVEDYGWQNHPAVKMWRSHLCSLIGYGDAVCREWIRRGYNDTCLEKINAFGPSSMEPPVWVTPELCASHRSNLKRKDPTFYASFPEPETLPYIWPL